ncbi:protein of unknown function [Chitinophaga costaii]|uniref:DUF4783 domain-containing protein n=1 Tax=Chitinophaga costaii TaxID=1335309 RepID=A0A1C4B469_9BACT|nr:DUF4783 domain-containing protein [Chitinophaga costaii]SCC01663.1 protein of unknown function [Chitinophaga costaii]
MMKKIMYVLWALGAVIIFTAFTAPAHSSQDNTKAKTAPAGTFDLVVSAIKQGNVSGLTPYLDNTIEINISGKSNSYSKTQAEVILKEFFSKNQVKSFDLLHQGEGGGGSRFGIGNMNTAAGAYRTYFLLQKKGSSMVLNELRFETK